MTVLRFSPCLVWIDNEPQWHVNLIAASQFLLFETETFCFVEILYSMKRCDAFLPDHRIPRDIATKNVVSYIFPGTTFIVRRRAKLPRHISVVVR